MIISDVAWVRDRLDRRALRLSIDGHPAHIPSGQRLELLRRGIVRGVLFLESERREQADHPFIQRDVEPGLSARDLDGCTDAPRVFALHAEMCAAISAGTWRAGPRAASPADRQAKPGSARSSRTRTRQDGADGGPQYPAGAGMKERS